MKKKVVILGAGLAGLSIARELLKRKDFNAEIEIIEREPYVGGLSASFASEGIMFDFGSHRLHAGIRLYGGSIRARRTKPRSEIPRTSRRTCLVSHKASRPDDDGDDCPIPRLRATNW